jgi:hypothetical protein
MDDSYFVFDFSEGFPNKPDAEIPRDNGMPIYEGKLVLCPYDNRKLVPIGKKKGGVLTDAGLLCKECGYVFDLFSGKEYRV